MMARSNHNIPTINHSRVPSNMKYKLMGVISNELNEAPTKIIPVAIHFKYHEGP